MSKTSLFLFFLILYSQLQGQNRDPRFDGLTEEVDSLMKKCQTVGVSITVVENDSLIWSRGFGYRNLEEKLPVTPNTLFPIASATKPISSSLIGVYVGKGEVAMHDKPRKYIPYLEFASEEMNSLITVEDLLAHRSGIGVVDAAHVFFPTNDIQQHLQRLRYLVPNSQVRERFDYSNMGYAILGEITAQISGKSWEENIHQEIFNPLQMVRSNCSLTALQADENFAYGYKVSKGSVIKTEYEDQHESGASGAINSCSDELAQWVKMLLNRGKIDQKQIIPKAYLEEAFSEHNLIRGSFSFDKQYELIGDSYGYGWFVHQYKGLYRVNHGGNVSGFTSLISLYPYKNIGIIILTNQGSANNLTSAVEDILINRLLGRTRKPWKEYSLQVGEAIVPLTQLPPINEVEKPSRPLREYCGNYFSKAYGVANVFQEDEKLMIQFPAFKMFLEHQAYNTFINRVVEKHHQNTPSFYIRFYPNDGGEIREMRIGFSEEPERFAKQE
ncbi:MAG: serine hydrolase [Bacteroidota bacterium]